MMMNAISQPKCLARTGMVSGAAKAPTEAPELKIEVAKARSFLGKYSAVTLMAAGKFPASPRARMARQTRKSHTLSVAMATAIVLPASTARRASIESRPSTSIVTQPHPACIHAPSDHIKIAQRYPFFMPIQSTNLPANRQATA